MAESLDLDGAIQIMRRVVGLLVDKQVRDLKTELPRLEQGTITAVNGGSPPTVNVQVGSGTFTNLRYDASITPSVNQVVWMKVQGADRFVAHVLA